MNWNSIIRDRISTIKEDNKKVNFFLPKRPGTSVIRIISGPVETTAKLNGKEVIKQQMVIIDRDTNKVGILSAGRGMFTNLVDEIKRHGNPINYDVVIHTRLMMFKMFPEYIFYVKNKSPLSDEDKILIAEADIPERFKVKKNPVFFGYLIIQGARFRITNKQVMLTTNGVEENLFGPAYPPCEIQYVDKDQIIIGRDDWDFKVPVDYDDALKKFAQGFWVPAKTLIERDQSSPVYCDVHRKLLPKGFVCCGRQVLTSDEHCVMF